MRRIDMDGDYMLRWPHDRAIIEQIISGETKRLGTYDEAKINDYIELFSAPPLTTGRNGVHSFPEQDALRVIIRVSKFEKGERPTPNLVYWTNFVEKREPDDSRGTEDNKRLILAALNKIGKGEDDFVPAKILAEATGIPPQEVDDHFAILDKDEMVECMAFTAGTVGTVVSMKAKGRFYLREVAKASRQTTPVPELRILLTWSGSASHEIALFFHTWLPAVLPGTKPWISDEDIAKGKRWFQELMEQLSKLETSIVFVTPENVKSPWVYFEVGVIAREVKRGTVYPYLVGLDGQQISSGPLGQFQWTKATKKDTWKLIKVINGEFIGQSHDEQLLESRFNEQWPALERQINHILETSVPIEDEILEVERPIEQQLSKEARQLLVEAARDKHGLLHRSEDLQGVCIMANENVIIESTDPRTKAIWNEAIDELCDLALFKVKIDEHGDGLFEPTRLGYEVADRITSQSL
jgi:hypothetical protein